jgi:enediyne biosynthesis protein E4
VHFGLGQATQVDGVEIHWPSKFVEHVSLPAAIDRYYVIQERKGVIPSVYDKGSK